MPFLSFLKLPQKKKTANFAKERLQIILARERNNDSSDFLPQLQKELLEVISKYFKINNEDVRVNLERQENLEILDIKIEIPPKFLKSEK